MAPFPNQGAFTPPAPYPGSKDLGILQKLRRNMASQIGSLPKAVYTSEAWKPPLPGMPLFVMAPDLVKQVLLDEIDAYPHGALFERIMRPAWGEGLLLAQGDDWKVQRRAAAQAFRASGMAALAPIFIAETEALIATWSNAGFGSIDLHEQMKRLTFNIIVETMLSGAEQFDRDVFREKVQAFFDDISKLRMSYVFRGDAYHADRPSAPSQHRAELIAHMSELVQHRRAAPPRGDLIDLLLVAEDPDSKTPMSDQQIADNLLGFVLAGYETTAAALTWTLYLISADDETEARLLSEYSSADETDTTALAFTQQVISEALRLYPPAFMLTRVAVRDARLGAHRIKRGQRVNIPIWAIHRAPTNWPQPHAFIPERFAAERPDPPRYTYLPFGAGPRICIGAAFALTEMRCILATLLPKVKIMPPKRDKVWPKTELALVPHEKMMINISRR